MGNAFLRWVGVLASGRPGSWDDVASSSLFVRLDRAALLGTPLALTETAHLLRAEQQPLLVRMLIESSVELVHINIGYELPSFSGRRAAVQAPPHDFVVAVQANRRRWSRGKLPRLCGCGGSLR